MRKTRLFIDQKSIVLDQEIAIRDGDFEYLTKVLRKKIADEICVFNGFDGDFTTSITVIEKKFITLKVTAKIAELQKVPNITLAFAPVKNVRVDFIAAKAVELGVARFQPIITTRTIVDKINVERFKANIKEACEQCERNDFAEVLEIKKLDKFLEDQKNSEKILILCDESGKSFSAKEVFTKIALEKNFAETDFENRPEIVILIGPEGGFAPEEFRKMRELKNLYSVSLGPRILRADTAIISALTLVQEFLGDFNSNKNPYVPLK